MMPPSAFRQSPADRPHHACDRGDPPPIYTTSWGTIHPDITVLSRDRGGGYGEAASKALPSAIQVADRWHLMENASSAFLSAVRKSMRPIRAAIGATTINPELLTCAERLQYEGYLRREETIATILALAKDGAAIKQIVRKTGHSRNRVRQVLRGDRGDVFRARQSSLDARLPLLDAQWAGGCRNGQTLAAAQIRWLPRLAAGGQRVGDPAPSRRKG